MARIYKVEKSNTKAKNMLSFDSNFDLILYIIQIAGCVSFSISGVVNAMQGQTGPRGSIGLTLVDGFGGGRFRDLCINREPPHIFWDDKYLLLAAISTVIVGVIYILACCKSTAPLVERLSVHWLMYVLDAIGIAVFTVSGVKLSCLYIPENASLIGSYVYVIALGSITGFGGGIFRDVFLGMIPSVFRKHFYMLPCMIGATVFAVLYRLEVAEIFSVLVGVTIIVTLRVLAWRFEWNLPQARAYEDLIENKRK